MTGVQRHTKLAFIDNLWSVEYSVGQYFIDTYWFANKDNAVAYLMSIHHPLIPTVEIEELITSLGPTFIETYSSPVG